MEEGFINGSIDLAFEQGGKFYVLDWKSNHLGNSPKHYHSLALKEAVTHSFYFLQYHLYSLALHSFLKKRLANYDYDEHFGGVFYAFVRGFELGNEITEFTGIA